MTQPKIKSKEDFSRNVENVVFEKQSSYIDAVLIQAKIDDIDEETASKLLTPSIKAHVRTEAFKLRMLKEKPNTQPTLF